jgi:DNA-binding transcriptional regulator LsrR (DeoR family)
MGNELRRKLVFPENLELLISASEQYYLEGKTQQQIAERLQLSRPAVSALLTEARQRGIVQFSIINPLEHLKNLETSMKTVFNLAGCRITPSSRDPQTLLLRLGYYASRLVYECLQPNDILGIGRGRTVHSTIKNFVSIGDKHNLTVVPLTGGSWNMQEGFQVNEMVITLAGKLHASYRLLNAPLYVNNSEVANALKEDESISQCTKLWHSLSCALVGIGPLRGNDPYVRLRIKTVEERLNTRVIGDLCGRFIDAQGNEISENNVMAIELSQLKQTKNVIAVAGGPEKIIPITSALKGKWITHLVTDEDTARTLLSRQDSTKG